MSDGPYRFKVADSPVEFEQIRRLNYRTFVEEIPQHAPNDDGRLVDSREDCSTFVVALEDDRVVGMIAVSDQRPFSLDRKLDDLDQHLPPARSICEIRLLAVDEEHRSGVVFHGLVRTIAGFALEQGWDLALISGTDRQLRLYRHLGFEPFGPTVGTVEATYQPMYLTLDALRDRERILLERRSDCENDATVSYLPGPVETTPDVMAALATPPLSHREPEFAELLADVRDRLLRLTGAGTVQVLSGSGTLVNDAVAARIAALGEPGVLLSHGEFGERLADHAARWDLSTTIVRRPWGSAFDESMIDKAFSVVPRPRWLWATHCETSTGVITDLDMLRSVTRRHGVHLFLDAVSTIGAVPVDLTDVALATGVSAKAIGAIPGLAFVFGNEPFDLHEPHVPRVLDLGLYEARDGIPFTLSSNLLAALQAALRRYGDPEPVFRAVAADGEWLRRSLRGVGLELVGEDGHGSPAVITVQIPESAGSVAVGEELQAAGFDVSFRSEYLVRRGWLQVCLMGPYRRDRLGALTDALVSAIGPG